MQEKIFEILFEKDEISWQSIIYELVKTEQMNPWDIDISLLTQKYIDMLDKLKELDFRISGKVLLAAAILLRIKSNRLLGEDILSFDKLFAQEEELQEGELGIFDEPIPIATEERYSLIPRTPQPRKRKVSIYDLVKALEKALDVRRRRLLSNVDIPHNITLPQKIDITRIIKDVYGRILSFINQNQKEKLTFTKLIPSENKKDKIYTFIPLLHLATQHKIELIQESHFGEIAIIPITNKEIER